MAVVAERIVTESIDELVREAETLKARLEEERAKFNDMECKQIIFVYFQYEKQNNPFFLFLSLFSNNCCRKT